MTFVAGIITWILIGILGFYIISSIAGFVKMLISRKKRAASDQNKTDEKEVDQSNRI